MLLTKGVRGSGTERCPRPGPPPSWQAWGRGVLQQTPPWDSRAPPGRSVPTKRTRQGPSLSCTALESVSSSTGLGCQGNSRHSTSFSTSTRPCRVITSPLGSSTMRVGMPAMGKNGGGSDKTRTSQRQKSHFLSPRLWREPRDRCLSTARTGAQLGSRDPVSVLAERWNSGSGMACPCPSAGRCHRHRTLMLLDAKGPGRDPPHTSPLAKRGTDASERSGTSAAPQAPSPSC